ncbi:MAG: septum formation protein Maf [Planctomycetota bacterium]|nr:MAG: septum formation protein Maf [Planctomycetota bacterium]
MSFKFFMVNKSVDNKDLLMMRKSQFILASASPRRRDLLRKAGYCFEIVPSDVDESAYDTNGITSEEHTQILALAKARDVALRFPNALVMGSDTVVDLGGEIIGKPDDADHAEEITRKLFSKPHKVITGLAMVCIDKGIEIVEADTTIVYPRQLTEVQIADHITNGQWQGKAGAYGIQETGDEFVDHIDGSFTNVMGLPMELTQRLLGELGIHLQ